jgi:hypothetical protein
VDPFAKIRTAIESGAPVLPAWTQDLAREDVAAFVAGMLGETETEALAAILAAIKAIGRTGALNRVTKARRFHAKAITWQAEHPEPSRYTRPFLMFARGAHNWRPRTVGGIWFCLAEQTIHEREKKRTKAAERTTSTAETAAP